MTNTKKTEDFASLSYKALAPRCKPDEPIKGPDWEIVAGSYLWMVEDLKWRLREELVNPLPEEEPVYSPEMTEAMGQIEPLKKWRKNTDVDDSKL